MRYADLVGLLVAMVLVAPTPAAAQEAEPAEAADEQAADAGFAEPSAEQVELNAAAVEAIRNENYEKAVRLLQASVDLGELNVTYLNLGRAHQKLGHCAEARKALLAAVSAPAVEQPPPSLVDAKVDEYLGELDAECAGPATAAGGGDQADPPVAAAATEPPAGTDYVGWSTVAAGGALLATSGVFYLFAQSEYGEVVDALDDANLDGGLVVDMSRREALEHQARGDTFSTVALSTAVAGVALTGLGTYLLFDEDTEARATVGLGAGAVGVQLGGQF